MGGRWGGHLLKAGRLLTFSAFRMGAYLRWALTRGWLLIRINTVCQIQLQAEGIETLSRREIFVQNFKFFFVTPSIFNSLTGKQFWRGDLFERGSLCNLAKTMVSVLHKGLEYKVEKPRIINKSKLPVGE